MPPSINQFSNTLEKNVATDLLKLLLKYQPETKAAKTLRLRNIATGKEEASAPPAVVKFGLNHVTSLIENKKAKLVVIAHDVDPIELVVFLPALCRQFNIPYCIVKGKARLGQLVHQKHAAVVALTHVNKEDKAKFDSLTEAFRSKFNDDTVVRRKWGGGIMGLKTQKKLELREKAIAAEAAKFQESLVDMLAQIGDVLPRFRIYERLFKNHERLLVALSAGYLDILRFCIASKDLFVKARKSKSK